MEIDLEEGLATIKTLQSKIFSNSPDRYEAQQQCDSLIENLIRLYPTDPRVLTVYGALLCNSGDHFQALAILKKAKNKGFEDRNLYRNIAIAKINIPSERENAKASFDEANPFDANPLTFEAYFDPLAH